MHGIIVSTCPVVAVVVVDMQCTVVAPGLEVDTQRTADTVGVVVVVVMVVTAQLKLTGGATNRECLACHSSSLQCFFLSFIIGSL